jgi:hypothetical protein
LDALDATESKRLLAAILAAHPELVAEAAELADAQLGAVTVEDVAEDVAFAVGELHVEDVWERSGPRADGEYVEPTEAAWTVVEEAVAPFIHDLARRLELGRRAEATVLCQGTLLGLYRVSQEEGDFLDGRPDSLEEVAALAIATWKKGRAGRATAGGRAEEWAAIQLAWRVPRDVAVLFGAIRETLRSKLRAERGGSRVTARPSTICSTARCSRGSCASPVRVAPTRSSSETAIAARFLCTSRRSLHVGLLKVRGRAPDDLVFELGLRPDRPPLARYRSGDIAVPEAAVSPSRARAERPEPVGPARA